MIDEAFKKLARFQVKKPLWVMVIVLLITIILVSGLSSLKMESDMSKMMPKDLECMKTMNIVTDEFGGTNSYTIVVEINPMNAYSDDVRDIRDPRVIEYADLISKQIEKEKGITGVSGVVDVLKAQNNGVLPRSKRTINDLLDKSVQSKSYISPDYDLMKINAKTSLTTGQTEDIAVLLKNIEDILIETKTPPGIKTGVTGALVVSAEQKNGMGPDMAITSGIALAGILICLCVTFVSVRYGLTTLLPVVFGVIWAFGFAGHLGLAINTAMVGAASIMLGLGVDFGIQTTNRFRQEIKKHDIDEAIENTMVGTGRPILTTGVAASIGFSAMLLGDMPMMHGLGMLMSYGVLSCVAATFLLLPAVFVLEERWVRRFGN